MKFFSFFYNSLFNISWLRQRKNEPGKSWGYFFIFCLFLSLVSTISITVAIPGMLKQAKTMVNEKVPENFSAEINNGKLSVVGLPQPFVFKDEEKNNFVAVIDTVSTSSLSLRNYLTVAGQSGVLIDSEKIEFLNGQNMQGQTQYWKDVKESNFRLDKPFLVSVLSKTGPVFVIIIFLVVLVALFVAFVVGKLFSILMVTLILLVVTAIARRSWRFGELFSVGLCAVTVPSLISLVFTLFGVSIPYVHFLALLAFMLAVVFTKVPEGEVVAPKKEEEVLPPTPKV